MHLSTLIIYFCCKIFQKKPLLFPIISTNAKKKSALFKTLMCASNFSLFERERIENSYFPYQISWTDKTNFTCHFRSEKNLKNN